MGKPGKPAAKRSHHAKKVPERVEGVGAGQAPVGGAGDSGGDDGNGGGGDAQELRASDFADRGSVGVVEVVEWVAERLDLTDTTPKDAPSALAWSQLLWARDNRDKFMALWKSTCANPKKLHTGEERDDGVELFALLDKLGAVRTAALDLADRQLAEGRGE